MRDGVHADRSSSRDAEGADERADADDREQDRERGARAVQVARREQREHGLEVVRQRSDHGHHHERRPQHRRVPGVAQARRAPVPSRAVSVRRRPQLLGPHHPERGEHREVRQAVEQEAPTEADGRDQQTGERRTDDARRRHQRAVEADRVVHVLGRHHLDHERAPRRIVERDGRCRRRARPRTPRAPAGCG